MKPWMTENEQSAIVDSLSQTDIMLEWGCGGSTLFFPDYVKTYYSIENNYTWYQDIRNRIPHNVQLRYIPTTILPPQNTPNDDFWMMESDRFKYSDIHALQNQYPFTSEFATRKFLMYEDYVLEINNLGVEHLDKVLVDGRARVFCALRAYDYLDKDSLVFVHDFNGRAEYYDLLRFYKVDRIVDSLAILKLR